LGGEEAGKDDASLGGRRAGGRAVGRGGGRNKDMGMMMRRRKEEGRALTPRGRGEGRKGGREGGREGGEGGTWSTRSAAARRKDGKKESRSLTIRYCEMAVGVMTGRAP